MSTVTARLTVNAARLRSRQASCVLVVLTALCCLSTTSAPALAATPAVCPAGASPDGLSSGALGTCGDNLLPRKSITPLPGGGYQSNYVESDGSPTSMTVPPASFNAATASPDERRLYGIPKEPPVSSPEYSKWKAMVDQPIDFVTPPDNLVEVPSTRGPSTTSRVSAGLAPPASADTDRGNATTGTNKIWSGYINIEGRHESYTETAGYFIEPTTVNKTPAGCENNFGSYVWAGIGGWGPGEPALAQDGTGQANQISQEDLEPQYQVGPNQAWYETIGKGKLGAGHIAVSNFYASPGSYFLANTEYLGDDEISYFMYNYKTKKAVHATGHTELAGENADYIVERQEEENLYNFKAVTFQGFTNNKPFRDSPTERVEMEDGLKEANGHAELNASPTNILNNYEFTDDFLHCKGHKESIGEKYNAGRAAPIATTGKSSEVTSTSAKLSGTINPEEGTTTYHFEYGTEADNYSQSTEEISAGEGKVEVPVTASISGLQSGTTYHYRVIANNPQGSNAGAEATFTTSGSPPPPPPTVTTEGASGLGTTTATLEGSVNPNGLDTHYFFEYGTNATLFESFAPSPPGNDAGSGSSPVKVSVGLTGLTPSTTYCYRMVASNSTGTSYGTEKEFATPFSAPIYSSQWGSVGSGNGQFNDPTFDAVDGSGNVWVSDSGVGNSRIEEFSSAGTFIRAFGSLGSGNGQFDYPTGIGINKSAGDVYVADYSNNRIEEFTASEGKFIRAFGSFGSGNGQLSLPDGVAVDSSGDVWVVDQGNNRIEEFSSTGSFIAVYGSKGSGNGQFEVPRGIAIDSANHVYVIDSRNDRIEEFSSQGAYLAQFGVKGTGNGQFSGPYAVASDARSGNVFVTDEGNDRIEVFAPTGTYLGQFGSFGTGNGQFVLPQGITINSSGEMYVVDTGSDRIEKFVPGGC